MKPSDRLGLKQLDRRAESLRGVMPEMRIEQGWIRYLRKAFGLSLRDLANRVRVPVASIQSAEKNEQMGSVSMNTLRKIADAMECDFVYAFVPRENGDKILSQAARAKALRLIRESGLHMALEDQKVREDLEDRVTNLAEELRRRGDIW